MPFLRLLPAAIAALLLATPAMAFGDPNDPDWPCVQRKVLDLSPAASWSGPAFDPENVAWRNDAEVKNLVGYLAQRRLPIEEATAAITSFAEAAGDKRVERLQSLYGGLFATLNQERRDVINGIGRFAKKQKTFADNVKQRTAELDKMRNDPNVEYMTLQTKNDEVLWETRVFEERQKSLTYVCEVPVIIEQRLFALGKAISAVAK